MPSRMFVFTRHLVEELMKLGERRAEFKTYSLLFLFAYAFLLRLPSEALPLAVDGSDSQSVMSLEGDNLVLKLKRRLMCIDIDGVWFSPSLCAHRKNRPEGCKLVRGCWCSESKVTHFALVITRCIARCMFAAYMSKTCAGSAIVRKENTAI